MSPCGVDLGCTGVCLVCPLRGSDVPGGVHARDSRGTRERADVCAHTQSMTAGNVSVVPRPPRHQAGTAFVPPRDTPGLAAGEPTSSRGTGRDLKTRAPCALRASSCSPGVLVSPALVAVRPRACWTGGMRGCDGCLVLNCLRARPTIPPAPACKGVATAPLHLPWPPRGPEYPPHMHPPRRRRCTCIAAAVRQPRSRRVHRQTHPT